MTDGIGTQLILQHSVILKLAIPSAFIHDFRAILYVIELPHAKEIYVYGIHYAHPPLHVQIEHSLLVNLSCCLYGLFAGKSSLKTGQAGAEGKHGYH